MKNKNLLQLSALAILIAMAILGSACKKTKAATAEQELPLTTTDAAATYKLVWNDEFNGTALDLNSWNYDIGYNKWGNNEQETYQAANVKVASGSLQITAKKEKVGNTASNYTSGRIHTLNKREFLYGKIEARMKLPQSKGLWPAFWMLGVNMRARGTTPGVGWPACGEIDIMETINSETWTAGAAHWAKADGTHTKSSNTVTGTPNDWHIYSVVWNKESISWYVDYKLFHTFSIKDGAESTSEFHLPFNLIFNLAVGGNWPGQVIDDTKLPSTMLVDYIRVFQEVQ